jgi:hypothetical protein
LAPTLRASIARSRPFHPDDVVDLVVHRLRAIRHDVVFVLPVAQVDRLPLHREDVDRGRAVQGEVRRVHDVVEGGIVPLEDDRDLDLGLLEARERACQLG